MGDIIDFGAKKAFNEMEDWEDDYIELLERNKSFLFGENGKMHIFGIFRLLFLNLRLLEGSVEIIKSSEVLRDLFANKGGKKFILGWLDDIKKEIESLEFKN